MEVRTKQRRRRRRKKKVRRGSFRWPTACWRLLAMRVEFFICAFFFFVALLLPLLLLLCVLFPFHLVPDLKKLKVLLKFQPVLAETLPKKEQYETWKQPRFSELYDLKFTVNQVGPYGPVWSGFKNHEYGNYCTKNILKGNVLNPKGMPISSFI